MYSKHFDQNIYAIKELGIVVSILLYLFSLTQWAYCTQSSCVFGFASMLTGWLAFYMGGVMLTWFANPAVIISWLTVHKHPKTSLAFSFLAVVISISFLFFKQIYNHQDEWTSNIVSYGNGYFLWIASAITMFAGNLLSLYSKFRSNKSLHKFN